MENRSEYFKAKRRVVLPLSKRKNLKGMPTEVLKKFLKSQDVYWHGSVLDKSGDLFQPKTVGEIKKAWDSGVFGGKETIRSHSPDRILISWSFRYVLSGGGCL